MDFFDFHHHQRSKNSGIYNLNFGEAFPESYFSAGIHPNRSENISEEDLLWLEEIVQNEKCVAIGECGLDGLIDVSRENQEKIFKFQIQLANKIRKPLIIHCVRRYSQVVSLLKNAEVPIIFHGYNRKKSIGEELLKYDFFLSFGKSVLHDVNLQQFVKDFPPEKTFLETDSADVDLEMLYLKVAELKNLPLKDLKNQIYQNLKIFNIPEFL